MMSFSSAKITSFVELSNFDNNIYFKRRTAWSFYVDSIHGGQYVKNNNKKIANDEVENTINWLVLRVES